MATRQTDILRLVQKLDPKRHTEEQPEYRFKGKVFTRKPVKPGAVYPWTL